MKQCICLSNMAFIQKFYSLEAALKDKLSSYILPNWRKSVPTDVVCYLKKPAMRMFVTSASQKSGRIVSRAV